MRHKEMKKLKKLIAVAGGILLLVGIMAGIAFTDALIQYRTTIREVPISEPAAMLFLGSGLIGLARVIRKRFSKKEILTNNGMVGYKFYWRDPVKGYQLIGMLPERRRNPNRITNESVLNWEKKNFANNLNTEDMFFIDVEINGETTPLIFEEGNGRVTKETDINFASIN